MPDQADRQAELSRDPEGARVRRCALGAAGAIVAATATILALGTLNGWSVVDAQFRRPFMPAIPEPVAVAQPSQRPVPAAEQPSAEADRFVERRRQMVESQLAARDIRDERVLDAMRRVPRHLYVPESERESAYADWPLQIGAGQTISQPYIVALMTQLARPTPVARALDVGTGSGYQAAVLAELCQQVYSIEIVESLARQARARLAALGYDNIEVQHGDGYRGWPERGPFDVIILAAAPPRVPAPLVEQLAVGGRLVLPVGDQTQELIVVEKQADGTARQWSVIPVRFVPMTGEAQRPATGRGP